MDNLEKLLAIEEIKQLEAKRVRFLDCKDWVSYAAVHVPEMEHTYGPTPPAFGIENVVEKVRKRLEGAVSIHHLHSPEIELTSSVSAKAVWVMEDVVIWREQDLFLHGYGHYFCDYVCRDDRWLISGRVLKRLWLQEGSYSGRYERI